MIRCALSILAVSITLFGAEDVAVLNYSVVGSVSCRSGTPCWSDVMKKPLVQRALLDIAKQPRSRDSVSAALEGSGVKFEDLLALRLIRTDQDRCLINFTLFTAEDVRKVRAVSEVYAKSLAREFMRRRPDIEKALTAYSAPAADFKAVAFIVLGCAALDWDGLNLTASLGYRKTTDARPDGHFVPYADERTDLSRQRIYWGSHNNSHGRIGLTSFGDHHSLPREAFPDIQWRPARSKTEDLPSALRASVAGEVRGKDDRSIPQLGAIMLSLRERERTVVELAGVAGIDQSDAKMWMKLLTRLDYVEETDGRYRSRIPVFTKADREMVSRLIIIGREIMKPWLAANYAKLKAELTDTTPMRSGVPYEEGFTMIWHYVFGMANQKLVDAGLFADAYDSAREHKGFIPTVYDKSVFEKQIQ